MRDFCWSCHRPAVACFCALARPFHSSVEFALVVHPSEVRSTVGTAWILRRSISNLKWVASSGVGLDQDSHFLRVLNQPQRVPVLLFPGEQSFNLSQGPLDEWQDLVPSPLIPLFVVLDGTWSQARSMLSRSQILQSLPRVSFDAETLSQYEFKRQPHPACLSSAEGVHRVIDVLVARGWAQAPNLREHDQILEIFRTMVRFQVKQAQA